MSPVWLSLSWVVWPRPVFEILDFGLRQTSGEDFFVNSDEEALAAGKDGAVGKLDLGLVEELAAGCAVGFCRAAEMAAYED